MMKTLSRVWVYLPSMKRKITFHMPSYATLTANMSNRDDIPRTVDDIKAATVIDEQTIAILTVNGWLHVWNYRNQMIHPHTSHFLRQLRPYFLFTYLQSVNQLVIGTCSGQLYLLDPNNHQASFLDTQLPTTQNHRPITHLLALSHFNRKLVMATPEPNTPLKMLHFTPRIDN